MDMKKAVIREQEEAVLSEVRKCLLGVPNEN